MIAVGPVAVLSSEKLPGVLDLSVVPSPPPCPTPLEQDGMKHRFPKTCFKCNVKLLVYAWLGMNISGPPRLSTKVPKKQLEHGGPHLGHLLKKVFLVRAFVLQLFFGNLC